MARAWKPQRPVQTGRVAEVVVTRRSMPWWEPCVGVWRWLARAPMRAAKLMWLIRGLRRFAFSRARVECQVRGKDVPVRWIGCRARTMIASVERP